MTARGGVGQDREVGFVGLGAMGSPMSRHLREAGWTVVGHDLDERSLRRHAAEAPTVDDVIELCGRVGVVVTSLPSNAAVRAVIERLGEGECAGLVIVETSTLTLAEKQAAHEAAAALGMTLLDCPVSGTSAQAEVGDVVAYLSGSDPAALERAEPVVASMTRAFHAVGDFGNGTRMKLVANLLVAVHNLAAAEALLLAQRVGLDLDQVLEAVGDGAGASKMLAVRGPLMVSGDFDRATARVEIFQKDLRAIEELAAHVSSPTPLLSASSTYYAMAMAQGRAQQDTASVFGVLAHSVAPSSELT
ncbi:NAD(P)-dependent oxidoreductase [Aeromicrobium sp. CFBP 8757]|uniref:NAD(P)-dependent oxidoreductase n=1 Tax=Aeromicrobium sp. CFBP 8757 TaxID=2775288 RepID=UPI001786F007|nr:NAD(P)-dependent oxidoreductase [Aeromicrobium sp. CFBP 8757]MBD8605542.1 NAD(P)-dependent oxidoreductase [Aeromicrobium sp. CFBP 8757]